MPDAGCRAVVIGIGNPDRGDDGAGRAVARWLHGKLPVDVRILEHEGEAASLLACLEDVSSAWLIDACVSGAPAGTVRRFDAAAAPLPRGEFSISTHGPGLADAVELARVLGLLPAHCVVFAIEAASFETGAPLSRPVVAVVAEVGTLVGNEIIRSGTAKANAAVRPIHRRGN